MSEQQQHITSSQKGLLPWWVRLCLWLWKLAAFLAVAVVLALIVNVTSTWLTSSKGSIPPDSPLGIIIAQWPMTLLVAFCLLLAAALLWVASRGYAEVASQPLPTAQDRARMLGRLRLRYGQMLQQSLQGADRIELGLASRSAAVQQAASLALRLPEQPDQPLPPRTSIVEAYDRAEQELLILGEPGAGKSTMLLELAHHLVEQAEQDTIQPLPVLLPLSSWAVKRPPLEDWLIEQVSLLYDVPKRLSRAWVQAQQILPLLDGLDEMSEAARPACIEAINTYHREHLGPLVICGRTNEYDAATKRERLSLHTAVIVQQLSYTEVDAHLATLGKPLSGLRTTLKKNTLLQTVATTPLLLRVLMLTYQGTSVRELSQKEAQLREQIWTDYIQNMVNRKGDIRRYPLDITVTRLKWLASQMRSRYQMIFFLERLQPDWLPKEQRTLYKLSTGSVIGLFLGLPFGLRFGLFSGLVIGLSFGLSFGLSRQIEPKEALTWSQERFWFGLCYGLLAGLFFGLLVGLLVGLSFGLLAALVIGVFLGLLVGLFFGLLAGITGKQLSFMLSPNEGIGRSLKNGLLLLLWGVLAGLFNWLLAGLVFGLLGELSVWLLVGPFVWLFFGLFFGLDAGLNAVIQHYTLRFWLTRSGLFPWKAIPFLEDATARILLRRIGGGYCFTHRLLLDHFADMGTPSVTSPLTQVTPPV